MRGLYWLSKDLFEPYFQDVTDPDAQGLSALRNHLEHKYTKVHLFTVPKRSADTDPFFDDFAYSLTADDLQARTLRLFKLVRAALIYVSLGMHTEEKRRRKAAPSGAVYGEMELPPYEDEQKRPS